MLNFDDLTEEQKAKAKACNSPEEMFELAQSEGYELSDSELAAISGGGFWNCDDAPCPTAWHA